MNFDVGFLTEIFKQTLGIFFSMGQVDTASGQGMLKIVDFFGMLGDYFVRGIASLISLFGGLAG
ncbi:MAG: hypothetical protein LBB75_07690 [Oscillospiraceae bacterium]|jgi:hypothetical protein|nr:hypothetical protein [Oscillospiraceae bacterium]